MHVSACNFFRKLSAAWPEHSNKSLCVHAAAKVFHDKKWQHSRVKGRGNRLAPAGILAFKCGYKLVIQWMGRSVPNCHIGRIGPLHGRRASPSVDMEVHVSQWRRTRTAASSSSFSAFWRRKFFQTGDRMKMLIAFERLFVCPPTMNERKEGPFPNSPLPHSGSSYRRLKRFAQLALDESRNLSVDSPPRPGHSCVLGVVTNWQSINCRAAK